MLWIARNSSKIGGGIYLFDKKPKKIRGSWWTQDEFDMDNVGVKVAPSEVRFALAPDDGPYRIDLSLKGGA